MLYVYTLFNTSNNRPLISAILDDKANEVRYLEFYLPGTGLSLYQIECNITEFKLLLDNNEKIVVNDYKQHISSFGISNCDNEIYDLPIPQLPRKLVNYNLKSSMGKVIDSMTNIELMEWHLVRARAAVVYAYLQDKGVLYGYDHLYPQYDMNTYSGRSRTTGFNIQGLSDEDEHLGNVSGGDIFINFDWVAFDLRTVALMCRDELLIESFNGSDPYEFMSSKISNNDDNISRDDIKATLLRAIYSINLNSPVFDFYSDLGEWASRVSNEIDNNGGYSESILGRKFRMSDERSKLSVFNAKIQGSGVHAMQNSMRRIWDIFPDNLLAETHDSIVITSSSNVDDIQDKIAKVARIMVRPFHGILEDDLQFPIIVSIGRKYRAWKKFKRFDNYGEIK